MDKNPSQIATRDGVDFSDHLRATLQSLVSSLLDVLASVGSDPAKPQEMARQFGLNKNLTWKVSKVVCGTDVYSSVPHIPGAAGLDIFLNALEKAGAPADRIARARRAAEDFEQVVTVHTGDRATLEIMVGGMLPRPLRKEQAEQKRKLAYQGNSATWGVRAELQLGLNILAPSAKQSGMADLVQVSGLVGFRRLRPNARWLLFRRERWSDDDPRPGHDDAASLDPRFPIEQGIPLLGEYCSTPIPDIRLIEMEGEDQYELPEGPVGNTAAFTCISAQVSRAVGPVAAEHEDEYAEIGCNLITPVRHLLFDLLVHRDLTWAHAPELSFYGRMDGGGMQGRPSRNLLPIGEAPLDLGAGTRGMATPLMSNYEAMLADVFARVDWNPEDFRAFRCVLPYPPIPTVAMFRSKLPV